MSWPADTVVDCCCGPLFTVFMQSNAELYFVGDHAPVHLQPSSASSSGNIQQQHYSAAEEEALIEKKALLMMNNSNTNNNTTSNVARPLADMY